MRRSRLPSAGEQGSRFSVVANEMKNLADQAKDSTVQVRTILGDIQRGINSSVLLTEEAVKRVEVEKQQVEVTEQTNAADDANDAGKHPGVRANPGRGQPATDRLRAGHAGDEGHPPGDGAIGDGDRTTGESLVAPQHPGATTPGGGRDIQGVNDIRTRLLAAFQIEHKEHLEAIRLLLLRLETGAASADDLQELFRQAHSFRAAVRRLRLHHP